MLAGLCGTHLLESRYSIEAGILLLCSSVTGHNLPNEGGYSKRLECMWLIVP